MNFQRASVALARTPRSDARPAEAPRILLVEDDERQRLLLRHLLEDRGYGVEAVGSAAAAIGAMAGWFDLLVTDVDIGSRLTGLDIARLVRAVRPRLPVIILSARAPAADAGEGIVHLRKPCTSAAVLTAVQGFAPLG
ncbi:MAG TPA: response regulator [Sphingobium sp.]